MKMIFLMHTLFLCLLAPILAFANFLIPSGLIRARPTCSPSFFEPFCLFNLILVMLVPHVSQGQLWNLTTNRVLTPTVFATTKRLSCRSFSSLLHSTWVTKLFFSSLSSVIVVIFMGVILERFSFSRSKHFKERYDHDST